MILLYQPGKLDYQPPRGHATGKGENYSLSPGQPSTQAWLHNGSAGKESACHAGDTGDVVPSLGWEDALEEEVATHSSIFAWKIPWTKEPTKDTTVLGGHKESAPTE